MNKVRLVLLAATTAAGLVVAAAVVAASSTDPFSTAPVSTANPLPYGVNVVDEQGDPYTLLITSTEVGSGRVVYYRAKATPTSDMFTPIGRAPATPNVPEAINPPYHLYMPVQRNTGYSLKVFVLAYISATGETRDSSVPITPSVAVDFLTNALITDLRLGSTYHGVGTPMLNFTVFSKTLLYEQTPKRAHDGLFDYDALFNRFNICGLVQQGLVDEVWVWGNRESKMNEVVENGPTWSLTTGSLPNCGKSVVTMGLNYYRDVSQAMESYSHGLEYMMQQYIPSGDESCDYRTNYGDVSIFPTPGECVGPKAISDIYGFTARAWPGVNSNVGVCGWSHQPPNQSGPGLDPNYWWTYEIQTAVQDRCLNWVWGSTSTSSFSCATYGCVVGNSYLSEERFLIWWMQHFPGEGNTDRNRNGLQRPNWWTIKFR